MNSLKNVYTFTSGHLKDKMVHWPWTVLVVISFTAAKWCYGVKIENNYAVSLCLEGQFNVFDLLIF